MALIRDGKLFTRGLMLMASFLVILVLMFMPIFGGGHNGLEYSDEFFNKLSKGSSFFFPELAPKAAALNGKTATLAADMKKATVPEGLKATLKPEDMPAKTVAMLTAAGFPAENKDGKVSVNADMGKLLAKALADAEAVFKVVGDTAPAISGVDGRVAMALWWNFLGANVKSLQKDGKNEEAKAIDVVMKKGIEPAYNFFGIPETQVMSSAGLLLVFLLVFYVVYTMWYGYAIFDLFGGIGLSMKKSKVKKEA